MPATSPRSAAPVLRMAPFSADFNHPLAGKSLSLEIVIRDIKPTGGKKAGECRDWLDILSTGPGIQARSPGAAHGLLRR
jgi:hypothetical protein